MKGIPRVILSNSLGTKLVIFDPERNMHMLMHGTTTHGLQSLDAARAAEPLVYYHRTGPIGDVFAVLAGREAVRAGIIGLGAGAWRPMRGRATISRFTNWTRTWSASPGTRPSSPF